MRSIKWKVFLFELILLCVIFSVFGVFNWFFIDDYFVYKSESQMLKLYYQIAADIEAGHDPEIILREEGQKSGVEAYLLVPDAVLAATPTSRLDQIALRHLRGLIQEHRQLIAEEYYFSKAVHLDGKRSDVVLIKLLEDQQVLVLSKPVTVIQENARMTMEFLLVAGGLAALLGSILVYFFAGRLTRPIVQCSHVARQIAQLDFAQRMFYPGRDELSLLADSINEMAVQMADNQKNLSQANAKLQADLDLKARLDQMRKNFVASVSHEFKSYIGLNKGYVEGLTYLYDDDPKKRHEYYQVLLKEAEKMEKFVTDLLELAVLESGVYPMEKKLQNISPLLAELLSRYQPLATKKEISLEGHIMPDLLLWGDQLKIERGVVNLLENALHYTPPGGRVWLEGENRDKAIWITVANSGTHLSQEALAQAWDSFYRGDKSRNRGSGSAGLGLSIVKQIVLQHQGSFRAENTSKGVSFILRFPQNIDT